MKSLKEYIINESSKDDIKHETGSGTGKFSLGDNYLDYYDEVTSYPEPPIKKDTLEIAEIYVKKENRRAYIGTKLMNAFLEFAGNKDVVVYAKPINNSMSVNDLINFYKKFGFKHDNRTKDESCLILKK